MGKRLDILEMITIHTNYFSSKDFMRASNCCPELKRTLYATDKMIQKMIFLTGSNVIKSSFDLQFAL